MKPKTIKTPWAARWAAALILVLGSELSADETLPLANPSFEEPTAGGGWYLQEDLQTNAAFGWENNLDKYTLAGAGASHFQAAADGAQALHLPTGKFIRQTMGDTAPGTVYRLTFHLLHSTFVPVSSAALKAEILDGDRPLAARIFMAPAEPGQWKSFTLTATSPAAPVGKLSVRFTGVTTGKGTGAWIDNISLSAAAIPGLLPVANPSFEMPVCKGSWWEEPLRDSFGWSHCLGDTYVVARGASHFNGADEGTQAMHLDEGLFLYQTLGKTEPDKFHTLRFSILQSKYAPNPEASLLAEILDGKKVLAREIFKVPGQPGVWKACALTAKPVNLTEGKLMIRFTGVSGGAGGEGIGPWLDNITLTATDTAPEEPAEAGGEDDITVASYYFGNYHPNDPRNEKSKGRGWSEWELVKAAKPRFPGHSQPHVPLWGYTDESDPAVMAQKIDAAADHGIDAFIFDWYYYNDGPFLDRPIDEGFLKAPNNHRLKFAFMWANHDWIELHPYKKGSPRTVLYPGKVTPENFRKICTHVIKDYFSHPSYWKIDGRPYFSFYDLTALLESFGSVEATRAALDEFRSAAKAAGLPGLHLNAVVWGQPILPNERTPADSSKLVYDLGFDSVTSYVWIHHVPLPKQETDYNDVREAYFGYWDKARGMFHVPYFPNVSMGWDPSPRCDQSDTFDNSGYPFTNTISGNTPERFRDALETTRKRLLAVANGPRILNINCWNEWTEGSYLEPDTVNGMKYLEAVKEVFGAKQEAK